MIDAIVKNLQRGVNLLNSISNDQYSNCTVAPYYSSIGCHMRHVLDVFSCVFDGYETNTAFLNKRKRNVIVEQETNLGIDYFNKIIDQLNKIDERDLHNVISVTDDLGLGVKTVDYSLAAILMQAHSHAIHHFASIGYIVYQLGIELPDSDFGYNPTTPKLKA